MVYKLIRESKIRIAATFDQPGGLNVATCLSCLAVRGVLDLGPGPYTLLYMSTQADINKKVVGHLEKLTSFVNYQVTETLPTFIKMAKKVTRARVVQRKKIHFDIEPQSSSSSSSDDDEEDENPSDQKKPKTEPETGKERAGQGCGGKKQ